MFSANLSASILRILRDLNLTHESAALLCKLSSRQFSNILRHQANISLASFEKICIGLRRTPNDLLGFPSDAPDLARNIPAPVIFVSHIARNSASVIPVCPFCESDLSGPEQHFCSNCGQKLDWSSAPAQREPR